MHKYHTISKEVADIIGGFSYRNSSAARSLSIFIMINDCPSRAAGSRASFLGVSGDGNLLTKVIIRVFVVQNPMLIVRPMLLVPSSHSLIILLTMSAAFSVIAYTVARIAVLLVVCIGTTLAWTTRSRRIPFTRSRSCISVELLNVKYGFYGHFALASG